MKTLIKQIESKGVKVTHQSKRFLWVKSKNIIIRLDSYDFFGLEEDDLGLRLKQRFSAHGVKIDLHNPDNNKPTKGQSVSNSDDDISPSVGEKKQKIREILKNKYKLLP